MIVAVKRNRKQKIIRYLSLVLVFLMFIAYYFYMSNEYSKEQEVKLKNQKALELKNEKDTRMKKLVEKTLLTEIEKTVDLLGQQNVKRVKVVDKKVVLVCEPNTNLEPLMVRYGTMALTKKTLNEIFIAIDVDYIIKSKLDVK